MIHCTERGCHCPSGVCAVQCRPERWVVVWFAPERRETLICTDRADAEAYAALRHGETVPLVPIRPIPQQRPD